MVALLKLGGSVITFKERPLTINAEAIEKISKKLKKVKKPLIIVHGGGSFGHYYSVKYDMHSKPDRYDIHGVSVVRSSMVELNNYITSIMVRYGLNPYTIPPSSFMKGKQVIKKKVLEIGDLAEEGLIPVTHGDILSNGNGYYYILSGDEIMSIFSKILKPRKVVFALNVDGLYRDMKSRKLIHEIHPSKGSDLIIDDVKMDVTGGMKRKIREAFKISNLGIDVMLINGLKPSRVEGALNDKNVRCTIVKGV